MYLNKSYKGDRYIGYGFTCGKMNMDISINANPIISLYVKNSVRTAVINIEVYI